MRVAVPALVQLRIAQAKVASYVDDGPPVIDPGAGLPRGFASGERREHHLRVSDIRSDHDGIRRAVQVWLCRAERLTLMGPGHRGDQSRLGVPQEQSRELAPGVAGDADDRYSRGHRKIMRRTG